MNNRTDEGKSKNEELEPKAEGVKQMNRRTIEQRNKEQKKEEGKSRNECGEPKAEGVKL